MTSTIRGLAPNLPEVITVELARPLAGIASVVADNPQALLERIDLREPTVGAVIDVEASHPTGGTASTLALICRLASPGLTASEARRLTVRDLKRISEALGPFLPAGETDEQSLQD